jgi:transcriptional regulator with PAS, ATPase and Fis domain
VARTDDATVLITGESGTGKELVAKAIHNMSSRKNNRFIAVNSSSIPEELFENEFFGHKKGSYTDAKEDQTGLFAAAHKGTLFLDEIGDLKYELQSKFLRVIEEKKISQLGTHTEYNVDVRIIAATNHDLSKMVEQKRFRTDLYHRLNIFSIDVPPLRERLEDVPLLVDHFIKEIAKKAGKKINRIDTKIFKKLTTYNFPGNVRELKNMIERAVILSDSEVLDEDCFISFSFLWDNSGNKTGISDDIFDLATIEKNHIIKILKKTKHNKSKAAGLLNISRQALDRKIEKYNI